MLELLRVVKLVSSRIAPGRTPSFTEAHTLKALETIKVETMGRKKLSKELELGEGVVRTLLKHLQNQEVIEISKNGISLTQNGNKLVSDLESKISVGVEVPPTPLTVGAFNIAVLVRDAAHKVKHGLAQRDTAIKAGASGATTLTFNGNEVTVPSMEGQVESKTISHLLSGLLAKFTLKANDVIIIGSGKNRLSAEIGAKMAAIELLRSTSERETRQL